jgi:hypothetical protein
MEAFSLLRQVYVEDGSHLKRSHKMTSGDVSRAEMLVWSAV